MKPHFTYCPWLIRLSTPSSRFVLVSESYSTCPRAFRVSLGRSDYHCRIRRDHAQVVPGKGDHSPSPRVRPAPHRIAHLRARQRVQHSLGIHGRSTGQAAPFPPSRTCVRLNPASESSRRKLVSRTKILTRSTAPSHLHSSAAGDLRKLPRQRVYGDTPPKKSRGRARAGLRALVAASVMDMETLQVPPTVRRPRYQRSSRSYAPKWRRKKRCSSALWQLLSDQG